MGSSPPSLPEAVNLGVGEGGFFTSPAMVRTVLGSCVAVTMFCPKQQIGAIFHALLPSWADYEERKPYGDSAYRYVDSAIECMVGQFNRHDVQPRQLVIKVYGGANALFDTNISVAGRNVAVALETLARHKLRVTASSVGGSKSRKLIFRTDTGEVFHQLLGEQAERQ